MVHNNGGVHVDVALAVLSGPALRRQAAGADDERRLGEPRFAIDLSQLIRTACSVDDNELEGLTVAGGRRQPGSLEDALELLRLNRIDAVGSNAMAASSELYEAHGQVSGVDDSGDFRLE